MPAELFKTKSLHVKNKEGEYSDVWLTPPEILHSLGDFDLDPCASRERPWPTADKHLTIDDDGLSHKWEGRVWLNPPYSRVDEFMDRMAEHNNGITLVFARTDTQYFHQYVFPVDTGIHFIEGRLTFHRSSGVKGKSNGGAPSVLISYGESNFKTLQESNIRGKTVRLN